MKRKGKANKQKGGTDSAQSLVCAGPMGLACWEFADYLSVKRLTDHGSMTFTIRWLLLLLIAYFIIGLTIRNTTAG